HVSNGNIFVMDSNFVCTECRAASAHTVNMTPLGMFRLKSREGSGAAHHLLQFVGAPWAVYDISSSDQDGGTQITGTPMYAAGSVWARGADGSLLQFVGAPWAVYNISNSDRVGGTRIAGNPVYGAGSVWARGVDGSLLQFVGAPWAV